MPAQAARGKACAPAARLMLTDGMAWMNADRKATGHGAPRPQKKRRETEKQRATRRNRAREREQSAQRELLALVADRYPASAAAYRDKAQDFVDRGLRAIEREIDGSCYEGCSIDEDSQDEVRAAIAVIRATLAAATWRYDPRGKARVRAALAAFDARADEQLQAWLRQAGVK